MAKVFSWIGAILTSLIIFIILVKGIPVLSLAQVGTGYDIFATSVPYAWWVWILGLWSIAVIFIIAVYRDTQSEQGDKIGCGIATLFFVSIFGELFTLCIPTENEKPQKVNTQPVVKLEEQKLTLEEAQKEIEIHRNTLKAGAITQEELDKRVKDIEERTIK